MLLQQTKSSSKQNSHHSSNSRNHPPFEEKNSFNQPVIGSKTAERLNIVLFIDYKHRKRSNDVESRYQQYETEDEIGNPFLYFHDFEETFLLFVAVKNPKSLTHNFFYVILNGFRIFGGFNLQFD